MNLTLYQELFEYTAFPFFVFSAEGKVLYRNLSAKKYLPMLRKNASVLPHLYPSVLPTKSALLHLIGDTPYRTMLSVWDGTAFIAFGFVRLQLSDGHYVGNWLLTYLSDPPQKIGEWLQEEREHRSDGKNSAGSRIYTDIFEILNYEKECPGMWELSFCDTVRILFDKLNPSFGALGYRINTAVDADCAHNRIVGIRFHDFLFIFGIFLYTQMRLSDHGDVSVRLKSNGKTCTLRFSVQTEKISTVTENFSDLLKIYLPECAWEFRFLQATGLLSAQRFRLSYGDYGIFTMEYDIPYEKEIAPSVKSLTGFSCLPSSDVDLLLDAVCRWLKDSDASY